MMKFRFMIAAFLRLTFVVFTLVALAGCDRASVSSSPEPTFTVSQTKLDDILAGNRLLAMVQNNRLLLVDPQFPDPVPIYEFKPDELPPTIFLDTFKVSPANTYVVWYSPTQGLTKLTIRDNQTTILNKPNDWFNTHPFFAFATNQEKVYLVDNQGTEFISIDLDTNTSQVMQIPYPFGTVFEVAPNNNQILFVSGYGRSEDEPQYMYTGIDGSNPKRFLADGFLPQRELISWLPDSSGSILVQNKNELVFFPVSDPTQPQPFMSLPQASEIIDLVRLDNLLYLLSDTGYWHIVDLHQKKEVGRVPVGIAQELHRPQFFPWNKTNFLIEETLQPSDTQFKRLWISDHTGIKKLIIDKYQEIEIQSDTPQL